MAENSTARVTTLDHVDNIKISSDVFAKPTNEYWALLSLRQGLEFLNRQVGECNKIVRQRVNPDEKLHIMVSGNCPEFEGVPLGLLTCAFHWYAVTACQYVRVVGAIAYRQDANRPLPPKYIEGVIPEVLAYRDKVAAHFAWAARHGQDTDAERLVSIMPSLTFVNDSFYVGGWNLSVRSGGKSSDSRTIRQWSLTDIHERLRGRYWPPAASRGTKGEDPPVHS